MEYLHWIAKKNYNINLDRLSYFTIFIASVLFLTKKYLKQLYVSFFLKIDN